MPFTSRERIRIALNHKQPDRVPIDLGSTPMTGISAIAYNNLKKYLGIKGETKVWDIFNQLAVVEEDMLSLVNADILPVVAGIPKRWKKGILPDGSPCKFPEAYNPEIQSDGSMIIREWQNFFGVTIQMTKEGYYYVTDHPLENAKTFEDLDNFNWRHRLTQDGFAELKEQAEFLHTNTSYALMAGTISGGNAQIYETVQKLRGWDTFLLDIKTNRKFAEYMLDKKTEAAIEWFDKYIDSINDHVDIVQVGDDLGTQNGLQISPEDYRKIIKPRHKKLWQFIKGRTNAHLWMHNCGSIYPLISDLIELGIDILNPIQVSAKNMDTHRLKNEFGNEITFWGGGCDTQYVLPFGKPHEVREEVKKRIDDLAPDGGFVFCPVMSILREVPPENILAMYEAVADYGKY